MTAPDGRPLTQILDDLAYGHDTAAGGIAAATTAAFAAAVAVMAAKRSRPAWIDAGGAAGQAEALRARLRALAQSDAEAYARVRLLLAQDGKDRDHRGAPRAPLLPRRPVSREERARELADALARAALQPLLIAEAAAEVATVGCWIADEGSGDHRADAVTAVVLAEGATCAAAHLVTVNLGVRAEDEFATRALTAVAVAGGAREHVLAV